MVAGTKSCSHVTVVLWSRRNHAKEPPPPPWREKFKQSIELFVNETIFRIRSLAFEIKIVFGLWESKTIFWNQNNFSESNLLGNPGNPCVLKGFWVEKLFRELFLNKTIIRIRFLAFGKIIVCVFLESKTIIGDQKQLLESDFLAFEKIIVCQNNCLLKRSVACIACVARIARV